MRLVTLKECAAIVCKTFMKVIMLFPTLKQMKRGESQLKELEKKAEK